MSKCDKCRKEYPEDHFTDGLCGSCLMEDHFCEDCEHILMPESDDLAFAQCSKAIQPEWNAMNFITQDETKNTVHKYYYCTSERHAKQCENFKFNTGA